MRFPCSSSASFGNVSSVPMTVGSCNDRAASAKRITPYSPSRSHKPRASRPSRDASTVVLQGDLHPLRTKSAIGHATRRRELESLSALRDQLALQTADVGGSTPERRHQHSMRDSRGAPVTTPLRRSTRKPGFKFVPCPLRVCESHNIKYRTYVRYLQMARYALPLALRNELLTKTGE